MTFLCQSFQSHILKLFQFRAFRRLCFFQVCRIQKLLLKKMTMAGLLLRLKENFSIRLRLIRWKFLEKFQELYFLLAAAQKKHQLQKKFNFYLRQKKFLKKLMLIYSKKILKIWMKNNLTSRNLKISLMEIRLYRRILMQKMLQTPWFLTKKPCLNLLLIHLPTEMSAVLYILWHIWFCQYIIANLPILLQEFQLQKILTGNVSSRQWFILKAL